MKPVDDYSGAFDPEFHLGKLSRPALARLAREYMMVGHIHDRALMPIVGSRYGSETMTEVAIDEWMGSSPIYNARCRALLGIEGEGVSSIFKGFQFDVGAPHQYMDFHYELQDESCGFFWLDYCGAYDDVYSNTRPGDERPIVQMCHHMEDPTFDATVMAVNPRARCIPVHRPPLAPDHSGPVCRWQVAITDDHGVVAEREITRAIRRSKAARFAFSQSGTHDGDGMLDYSSAFDPDFALEDLAQPTLVALCKEFALDVHLLVRAGHLSVESRWGEAVRREIAREHWAGSAPVYGNRIRAALGISGKDMSAILKMLQVDPAFPHEYVKPRCRLIDEQHGLFWIEACDGLVDDEPRGWLSVLDDDAHPGIDAVIAAVEPRARCRRIDPASLADGSPPAARAWALEIDDCAEPTPPSPWARIAGLTSASSFVFRVRTPR